LACSHSSVGNGVLVDDRIGLTRPQKNGGRVPMTSQELANVARLRRAHDFIEREYASPGRATMAVGALMPPVHLHWGDGRTSFSDANDSGPAPKPKQPNPKYGALPGKLVYSVLHRSPPSGSGSPPTSSTGSCGAHCGQATVLAELAVSWQSSAPVPIKCGIVWMSPVLSATWTTLHRRRPLRRRSEMLRQFEWQTNGLAVRASCFTHVSELA
jgi:hypothetical protein